MTNNQSYVDVLSAAPRLVIFGALAMFAGDIANNYVLAKMKVWTNGRYIYQPVSCLDPVRTNSEYRRLLHLRPVGDGTDTRTNKKHSRCKPYKS
jgi:hypothetical protein